MRAEVSTVGPLGKNIALLKICPSVDQGDPAVGVSARIALIRELIQLRDGLDQLDVLDRGELQEILKYACTN